MSIIQTLNLKEKQAYYHYAPGAWAYKEPPVLPREVADALESERLDGNFRLGDKYRILWMGVGVYRRNWQSDKAEVRGDIRACIEVEWTEVEHGGGNLFVSDPDAKLKTFCSWYPKACEVDCQQQAGIFYKTPEGKLVRVNRPDEAPIGSRQLVEVLHHTVSYGVLEWHVQQRLTRKDCIENHLFDPTKEDVPAEYWHTIDRLVSREGLYLDPTLHDIEKLLKREEQYRNLSPGDLNLVVRQEVADREADLEKDKANTLANSRVDFDVIMEDLESHCERRPASVSAV